jgi:hypothetical protein
MIEIVRCTPRNVKRWNSAEMGVGAGRGTAIVLVSPSHRDRFCEIPRRSGHPPVPGQVAHCAPPGAVTNTVAHASDGTAHGGDGLELPHLAA